MELPKSNFKMFFMPIYFLTLSGQTSPNTIPLELAVESFYMPAGKRVIGISDKYEVCIQPSRTGRSVCPFQVIPSADQAVLASAKIGGNCWSQGQPTGIFLYQKDLNSLCEIMTTILCNGLNHNCTSFMSCLVSLLWSTPSQVISWLPRLALDPIKSFP